MSGDRPQLNPTTTTTTIESTGTIYVFNPQTNMFVPYRPDFSGGIPVNDFNMLQQQRSSKQRAPIRDNQMGIIVPLIRTQPRQSDWPQLASVAQRYPRVNTIAVVSPSQDSRGLERDSGPDAEFSNGVRFLQNASVIALGYMMVSDNETADNLRTTIDRWKDWYPDVNGLYFDIVETQNFSKIEQLASYAKVDKGFRYVFANMASSTSGGVFNRVDDFVAQMKGVDTFVLYEREGYPSDAWYASIKKDWMSQYPRSKFAFIVYRVGPETLDCRNFIDKCVSIEKMAGYIYVQAGSGVSSLDDRRKMREMTNISSLTEICLNQLSSEAITESIPATRGVAPESTVIDTQKDDAGLEGGRGGESKEESPETIARENIEFDKFGVRKIYPSAAPTTERGGGGIDWYLFAENPRADVRVKNLPDRLTKEDDGSWSIDQQKKGQVGLEAWSPHDRKFLNVEITGYFKTLKMPSNRSANNTKYLIQQSARGGHLYEDMKRWCEGSGYTGQLMPNGTVAVVKTIHNNANTGNRGTTQATTNDLQNRWIGMKTIIYNYTRILPNAREGEYETFVAMEIWIDDNVTDENGNLVVRNDWRHVMTMHDEGGWFASELYSTKSKKGFRKNKCPRLNLNNENPEEKSKQQFRQRDEIITMPGGAENGGNCVAWRLADKAKVAFKHLSVREIARISPD